MKWFLGLDDHLSKEADGAAEKLKKLEHHAHALRQELEKTDDKALARKISGKLSSMQVEKIGLMSSGGGVGPMGGFVATLDHGLHILEMMGEAALKVGETLFDWGKEAIHAAGEKQREFFSFRSMIGDAEQAKALMEKIEAISDRSTFSGGQMSGVGKKLLAAGGEFNAETIPTYLRALSDAAGATGKSIDDVDGAVAAMVRINATGKLSEKTLLQLGKAGVPVAGVYQSLAETMHLTNAEAAKALVRGGMVSANEGLFAAVKAVRDSRSGGTLGSAGAAAVAESSDVLLSKIQEKWHRTFESLWDTKGFGKWTGFLGNLNTALDSTTESGRRLKEAVGDAFDRLFAGVFGTVSGPDGLGAAEDLVLKLANGIDAVGAAAGGFAKGLLSGFIPSVKELFNGPMTPEKLEAISAKFEGIGKGVQSAASAAASLVKYLGMIITPLDYMSGFKLFRELQNHPVHSGYPMNPYTGKPIATADEYQEIERRLAQDRQRENPAPPAPAPSASASRLISSSQSSTSNATVNQTINVSGSTAADPRAIGTAARDGASSALASREVIGHALGAFQ